MTNFIPFTFLVEGTLKTLGLVFGRSSESVSTSIPLSRHSLRSSRFNTSSITSSISADPSEPPTATMTARSFAASMWGKAACKKANWGNLTLESSEDEVATSPEDHSGVSSEDHEERVVSLNAPFIWAFGSLTSQGGSVALADSSDRVFLSWFICCSVGSMMLLALHSPSTSVSNAASNEVSNRGQ